MRVRLRPNMPRPKGFPEIVPVTTTEPLPQLLRGQLHPCYLVDLNRLPAPQLAEIVTALAERFNTSPHDVIKEIAQQGLPIRASFVDPA